MWQIAATFAAILWTMTAAWAASDGHCMTLSDAGGCAKGKVTNADGILLPGAHVYFSQPTRRYDHAVLGDDVEWGSLVWLRQGSPQHGPYATDELVLPQNRVFEDIRPRLVDLDGDGSFEIIVVETHVAKGAQLAVYALEGFRLVKRTATPYIGRPNRWLAPLGAGDLDGDGYMEIAYIDRPHLAKTLRIWRYQDGNLTHVADQPDLTNHRIGEDYISGGIRTCAAIPEIITTNANRTRMIASTLKNGAITSRDIGAHTGPANYQAALACR
ncbi:MAG: VCBS repeat-containing protein [Rhodobacteraceae bacterium]|nr:VCBS repeat-containing protein [Paracoccaceae bacterium]